VILLWQLLAKYAVSRLWRLRNRLERRRLPRSIVLDVPTYDGAPSVGHPDVFDAGPDGWHGWRYWMAFTPYPDADRENPSIVVSNDGITWLEPDGFSNPVVTRSEARAEGFLYNSDPELALMPDGNLALYYRPIYGRNSEAIYRKISSDGVTWSEGQELLVGAQGFCMQSPTVVVEEDGTLTMWTVNAEAAQANRVERRTSDDGISWSRPKPCAIPRGVTAWHLDVLRTGEGYRMLLASSRPWRLFYWTSTDGHTWGGGTRPVPLSGDRWDRDGNYRSSFVHRGKHVFDLWTTGIDASRSHGRIWKATWRIGHARSVALR
jgi:hypothetical protein